MERTLRLKKLAQASMGLATNFDEVGATKQTVMSDDRDFSRPRESFYTSNAPADLFSASDGAIKDNFIEEVQKFLKTRPLGVEYSGEITGLTNPQMLNALNELETKLQNKFPDKIFTGTIVTGNKINQNGFVRAVKMLGAKPLIDNTTEQTVGDDNIKKFQTYFGLSPTGIVDDKLISAAKSVEDKIAKATNNPDVKGLLWNDISKKFNTNLADVQEALKKVQDFEATKIANSHSDNKRIKIFIQMLK